MIKQTVAVVVAIALVLTTVIGTAQARFGDTPYQSGWRDGYAAHLKGEPYLCLCIGQGYSQGYSDGYNAYTGN